jgi:hypothetical protein
MQSLQFFLFKKNKIKWRLVVKEELTTIQLYMPLCGWTGMPRITLGR